MYMHVCVCVCVCVCLCVFVYAPTNSTFGTGRVPDCYSKLKRMAANPL